jgi:hypothetical protein
LSLDQLVKASAVVTALVYAALFSGYHRYYSRLDIEPEDLGVTNTFILVRSVGFIIVMLGLAGLLFLVWSTTVRGLSTQRSRTMLWSFGWYLLLCVALGGYIGYLMPSGVPIWVGPGGAMILVSAMVASAILYVAGRRTAGIILAVGIGSILTVVIPAISVNGQAQEMADMALSEHPVEPYTLFNLPVLDVSADPVTVSWIGQPSQRPALFGQPDTAPPPSPTKTPATRADLMKPVDGLLLGQGQGVVIILVGRDSRAHIVRLPSTNVMIDSYPR